MTESKDILFISHPESGLRMYYRKFGSGPRHILAFHGFGRDSRQFAVLEEFIGSTYTIISFDLFFHGHGTFEDPSPEQVEKGLYPQDLYLLMEELFKKEHINRFSVAGFSIGARFALTLVHLFPEKAEEVFLFAPDGLEERYLYRFATRHFFGKYLFRMTLRDPSMLRRLLTNLRKWNILDPGAIYFIRYYLDDPEHRKRLYNTWMFLRYIYVAPAKVQHIINSRRIKLRLFMGKYDRVIRLKGGKNFISKIKEGELVIADTGHSLMSRQVLKTFNLS